LGVSAVISTSQVSPVSATVGNILRPVARFKRKRFVKSVNSSENDCVQETNGPARLMS
jgi:hypothetical protein